MIHWTAQQITLRVRVQNTIEKQIHFPCAHHGDTSGCGPQLRSSALDGYLRPGRILSRENRLAENYEALDGAFFNILSSPSVTVLLQYYTSGVPSDVGAPREAGKKARAA